jgi:uncharacterized protein YbjT (DUF2867 family)
MRTVLLVGARGFIGRHLWAAMNEAGHVVVPTTRSPAGPAAQRSVTADFTTDVTPAEWAPRLAGVDVVVNAAGVFSHAESPAKVHSAGPRALFAAAAEAGVKRIVQISALGADRGTTEYFATKNDADRFLGTLPIESIVVQPSLVFAPDGRSARLFLLLATLPVLVLPRAATQLVQPVHADDLAAAVLRLIEGPLPPSPVRAVGGVALSLQQFLATLRGQLGYPPARTIWLPDFLSRLLGKMPPLSRYLGPDTLRMLATGNTAATRPFAELLGRPPRTPGQFMPASEAPAIASAALLAWTVPVLQTSIAALWVWTGIVSLGLYPIEGSLDLLQRTGIPAAMQPWALGGAATLDITIGLLLLPLRRFAWIWRIQLLVIVCYTALITVFLPEFWLHPYGPISKNIPLLGLLYLLQLLATRRWNT